ncbi:unnamed protein product [Brassica oleracea var. botrytis]
MSLFLSRFSRKPELVRRSFLLLSNVFSTSLCQTHPCSIIGAKNCLPHKRCLAELVYDDCFDTIVTIGASHGWVASLKEYGIMRLHDDLNPYALYKDPISLPNPNRHQRVNVIIFSRG